MKYVLLFITNAILYHARPAEITDDIRFINNGLTFIFFEMKYEINDLFGFCEDYKCILINCNQQLILNRPSIDINAIKQYSNNKTCHRCTLTKRLKTSNKFEKPRYVIIGFQTNRKNSSTKSISFFDHCKIKNLKIYLNAEVFPYEDFQCDFTKNKNGRYIIPRAVLCSPKKDRGYTMSCIMS
ncbi:Uncharacterized protein FWK35_00025266 [Aphis craccivora]|uniref:Double jelly roll-like domain-containing protein n=1 Tax=Aphis craccivora TaxID=307492 RepID=A0A6G0Y1I7_APHCR|nr:Uncharacterized protein FWK35_00025266 [Aphis craccivora]